MQVAGDMLAEILRLKLLWGKEESNLLEGLTVRIYPVQTGHPATVRVRIGNKNTVRNHTLVSIDIQSPKAYRPVGPPLNIKQNMGITLSHTTIGHYLIPIVPHIVRHHSCRVQKTQAAILPIVDSHP